MRFFSNCAGECCVCGCEGYCLAGHGDDDFFPAKNEQIIKRLDNGKYPHCRQKMIDELARRGIVYIEKGGAE